MSRIVSYAQAATTPNAVNNNVFNTRYKSLRNVVRARALPDITEESSVRSQSSDDEQDTVTPSSVVISLFEDINDNISSSSEPLDDVHNASMGSEATVIASFSPRLNPKAPAFPPGLPIPVHYFIPDALVSDGECTPAPHRPKLMGESANDPEWVKAFLEGSRCDVANSRDLILYANSVCCHPSFNVDSDLSALAHKFTVQASLLKLAPGPDSLAPFTAEMHRTVGTIYGSEAADSFRAQLESTCTQCLQDFWENDIIAHSQAEAQKLFAAIISLGGYIGELYVHGLLSGERLNACMLAILKRTHSVEHIRAVHHMLMRSRGGYWIPGGHTKPFRRMIVGFMDIFDAVARDVTYDMSLTDTVYAPAVLTLWVDEVYLLLHDQMLAAVP